MEGTSNSPASSLEIPPRTLGVKVFDFLPETVSGKLATSYKREELARRIVGELGKEQRSDKSIHDGVISSVFLDENIPSSIKKSILKHLGGNVPVDSLRVDGDQKPVMTSVDQDVKKSASKKVGENGPFANSPRLPDRILDDYGENIHERLPRVMKFLPGDHSDDPPKNFSEENKRRNYSADYERPPKSIEMNSGSAEASIDDQKVTVVPRGGYLGSPEYKEAIDDQAEIQPETKNGIDADDIVKGLRVTREIAPEIVIEGDGGQKDGDGVLEKNRDGEEKENVLEGEYLPEGEDSLQEIRDRIEMLKKSSDEARNRFLALRHRNTSKWLAVKKALFSSRSKELPESLVDEMEVLKSNWNYTLTRYKDAVVELAKREAMERKLDGKAQGALMAEAIRGLDMQGSIENYDAWKNASWGDRKDSNFLRVLGRARDWAEEYRKLDWKKRVAISAVVVGTGVAGVAVGSAGLVGVGVAGSMIVRLLGAYGVGRGSYEFLEGRANQKTLQYHEAALSNVEKIEDIGFLERRMKTYADRVQKDLDRAIAGNRKRVAASVAFGSVLFLGGTAFAHRGAIQEFSGKVSKGFSEFLEQMKIITGIEDFRAAPVSIGGASVDQAVEVAGVANLPAPETVSSPMSTPSSPETGAPSIESRSLVFGDQQGMPDQASHVEAIEKMTGGGSVREIVVGQNSSIEGAMKGMGTGGDIHRAYLEFLEKLKMQGEDVAKLDKLFQGKTFPGDRVYAGIGPDGKLHIFGIERESGGASLWKKFVTGFEETVKQKVEFGNQSVSNIQPSVDITLPEAPAPNISRSPFFATPNIYPESPPDILDGVLPPKVSVPPLQDTLRGNIDVSSDTPRDIFEKGAPGAISTSTPLPHSPVPDFETLDLTVPGSEYLKNVGTIVNERLTFLPISQTQKDLIENIFSARIPTSGTEPTASSVLFVRDTLGKALFSSEDVARWMQADISQDIKKKVNAAVYAGIVRIGGESLRIGNMIAQGETVGSWLTKMARYILTHPIEIKK